MIVGQYLVVCPRCPAQEQLEPRDTISRQDVTSQDVSEITTRLHQTQTESSARGRQFWTNAGRDGRRERTMSTSGHSSSTSTTSADTALPNIRDGRFRGGRPVSSVRVQRISQRLHHSQTRSSQGRKSAEPQDVLLYPECYILIAGLKRLRLRDDQRREQTRPSLLNKRDQCSQSVMIS